MLHRTLIAIALAVAAALGTISGAAWVSGPGNGVPAVHQSEACGVMAGSGQC